MSQFKASCKRYAWLAALVALAALLMQSTLVAQTTGTFFGTVNDPAGAVVPNAKITLTNERSGDIREATSNQVGHFTFAGVIPGTYAVKVEAKGFKAWQKYGLVMNVGDTRDISGIQLAIGSGSDTVTVEVSMGQVETVDSGEHAAVLETKDIENLGLVGRDVTELLKVLPGVAKVSAGIAAGDSYNFKEAQAAASPVGVGVTTNGAALRGGNSLLLDGANVLDPGCLCWGTSATNPEFTQEVKVQTSNFGADTPNGPVVINVMSKYGTNKFHGAGYLFTRNAILSANDHQNNINNSKRPDEAYYYPGGNLGGPIPGTKGKLQFWSGYEYFWQKLPGSNQLAARLPTADMLAGNFGPTAANLAMCPNGIGTFASGPNAGQPIHDGSLCSALGFVDPTNGQQGYGPDGSAIAAGTTSIAQYLNSTSSQMIAGMLKAYLPSANVTPSAANQYVNFYLPYTSQHNGYLFRQRLDYSLSDSTKVFASYQYGNDGSMMPAHMWWNPGGSVPYPGGGVAHQTATHTFSTNFLHVFSPTLTNEAQGTWQLFHGPMVGKPVTRAAAGWDGIGTYYSNNDVMLPTMNGPGTSAGPVMDQPDLFSQHGAFPSQKIAYSFGDSVTKLYKNHMLKAGVRFEKVGNAEANWAYPNGQFSYNAGFQQDLTDPSIRIGTMNPMANLLMGIGSGYSEGELSVNDVAFKSISFFGQDDWKVSKRLTINLGARFERLGRWEDASGIGAAVWLPGRYASDVANGKPLPGVWWHALDPGIPVGGYANPGLSTSPRLGMALDVFGNGKTVVRGGWGMYRFQDQPTAGTGMFRRSFSTSSRNLLASELASLAGRGDATSVATPPNVTVADPLDKKNDYTNSWNFTISQHMPWNSVLEVAYVGSETGNLLLGGQSGGYGDISDGLINQNKMAKGALFGPDPITGLTATNPENVSLTCIAPGNCNKLTDYQPYQAYSGSINVPTHKGWSNYNALQVAWLKRSKHANINLNYTWSKALGIVPTTVDAYDIHNNYGVLNIDRPRVFNASYSYEFGKVYASGMKLVGGAINGWTVSGTTTIQSGPNLQALQGQNLGMQLSSAGGQSITTKTYFGTDQGIILPILTCDPHSGLAKNSLINMSCISAPAIGHQGRMQLGYLYGPKYWNSDLSLFKNFKITEGQNVQFRFSAFNFLNNGLLGYNQWWSGPIQPHLKQSNGGWVDDGTSGNGVQTNVVGHRDIELGLKYTF